MTVSVEFLIRRNTILRKRSIWFKGDDYLVYHKGDFYSGVIEDTQGATYDYSYGYGYGTDFWAKTRIDVMQRIKDFFKRGKHLPEYAAAALESEMLALASEKRRRVLHLPKIIEVRKQRLQTRTMNRDQRLLAESIIFRLEMELDDES